jgi:hypothetical protein
MSWERTSKNRTRIRSTERGVIISNQLIRSTKYGNCTRIHSELYLCAGGANPHGQIMRRARLGQARFVVDRRGERQIVIMEIKDLLKTISTEKKVITAIRNTGEKRDRRTDTDF